jgi:hypothetical protein
VGRLRSAVLVDHVLRDRRLLSLLGYDNPGRQVGQRAEPAGENGDHSKDQPDQVGVHAEVDAESRADARYDAAVAGANQHLAAVDVAHAFIMPDPAPG